MITTTRHWLPLLAAAAAGLATTATAAEQQLAPIVISGAEDMESYVAPTTRAATKDDTPVLEAPMAVQSTTRATIEDQAARSALEALQYVSGVQSQPGTFYDQYQIRGFTSGYGVSYRNGLQLEGVADAVNMAFVDRIEVIKGPASMLYGRVEPGGFVNVVTLQPEHAGSYLLKQQAGSWNNWHTTADATGPIGSGDALAYRLIGDYEKGDNYFPNDHRRKLALFGALSWQPTQRLQANLSVEYYDYKGAGRGPNVVVPVVGTRPDDSVPRDASTSDPVMWAHFPDTVKRRLVAFDWTLQLGEDWKLTNRAHYVGFDEVQTGFGNWGDTRGFIYNPLTRYSFNVNLDLAGRVRTGGILHHLLLGIDDYRYSDHWMGTVGTTDIPAVDVFDPVFPDVLAELQSIVANSRHNVLWRSFETGAGVYFQDQMDLGSKWRVLLGGRLDRAYQRYSAVYGGSDWAECYPQCTGEPMLSWPNDNVFSPRLAVLYRLTDYSSVYASFTKAFGANNSSWLADGVYAAPESAVQYELGAKSSWLDDHVFGSATLFQLTKRNILGPNPADPFGPSVPIGKVRSRGLELDLAGQPTRHLEIKASYTVDAVTLLEDTNGNAGHRYQGTPLHSASLWSKYESARDADRGWQLGLGIQADGLRQGDNANSWQLPGYAVFEAMAAWRTVVGGGRLSLQLNVKNLFDRHYFDQIGYGTASWGEPRSLTGVLRMEW
ncbi:MAG: TonB-dependent siderophore receptor [Steroidobacteraceae bacterium]